MPYEIDDGVPMTRSRQGSQEIVDTLAQMKPGQSVKIDNAKDANKWRTVAKRRGARVATHKDGDGYRVWLLETE